ncbi:MAG TPA: hypothetical protein VIL56_07245, partial [Gaiellaceae bacterium]
FDCPNALTTIGKSRWPSSGSTNPPVPDQTRTLRPRITTAVARPLQAVCERNDPPGPSERLHVLKQERERAPVQTHPRQLPALHPLSHPPGGPTKPIGNVTDRQQPPRRRGRLPWLDGAETLDYRRRNLLDELRRHREAQLAHGRPPAPARTRAAVPQTPAAGRRTR